MPDNGEVCGSLQNCGSSTRTLLLVTLLGAKNLVVASRYLENLWIPETDHENAVCRSVCNVVSFTSLCDAKK